MATRTRAIYGVVLVLVALLIISAVAGIYYYSEYEQATQSKNRYVSELVSATSEYNRLASNYNSSLSLDNETLSLLAGTIAVVNTTEPIYKEASAQLSQLWEQYLSLKPATSLVFRANFLIDFGNGTARWYNDTEVQPGWNMYLATVVLSRGDLQAQWYPPGYFGPGLPGEHFVSGIDGVSNSRTMYWFLWTYNETAHWQTAQVGADLLPVYNGSVFAWTYCGENASYEPTCTP